MVERKALLIGVQYTGKRWLRVPGKPSMEITSSHDDVSKWKEMLTGTFGYSEKDIVCLMDTEEMSNTPFWPNRANIIREMQALAAGTRSGDKRFLFVAAHGDQKLATADSELDGQDEFMWTSEQGFPPGESRLVDDVIYRELVQGIARGASLTAVVATCHSGTFLDLPFRMEIIEEGKAKFTAAKTRPEPLPAKILCISACQDDQEAQQFDNPNSPNKQIGIITECIKHIVEETGEALPLSVELLLAYLTAWLKGAPKPQSPYVTCGNQATEAIFAP